MVFSQKSLVRLVNIAEEKIRVWKIKKIGIVFGITFIVLLRIIVITWCNMSHRKSILYHLNILDPQNNRDDEIADDCE